MNQLLKLQAELKRIKLEIKQEKQRNKEVKQVKKVEPQKFIHFGSWYFLAHEDILH